MLEIPAFATAEEIKTLLEWISPSRIFAPKDKKYFSNLGLVVLIAGVVLIFFKELVMILVVLALAFVAYVLATVPPEKIKHKITTQGVTSAEHNYFWKDLRDFWFTEKEGATLLHIDTSLRFPARLIILLASPATREALVKILSPHLPYQEKPKENAMDATADWFAAKLNLR